MPDEMKEVVEVRRRIAQNLKRMRSRRKLTQYAVADLAGINGRHMQAIEGGLENPTISTLTRIALALEVDIRDLFDR